jgi:hypothetical protein
VTELAISCLAKRSSAGERGWRLHRHSGGAVDTARNAKAITNQRLVFRALRILGKMSKMRLA